MHRRSGFIYPPVIYCSGIRYCLPFDSWKWSLCGAERILHFVMYEFNYQVRVLHNVMPIDLLAQSVVLPLTISARLHAVGSPLHNPQLIPPQLPFIVLPEISKPIAKCQSHKHKHDKRNNKSQPHTINLSQQLFVHQIIGKPAVHRLHKSIFGLLYIIDAQLMLFRKP